MKLHWTLTHLIVLTIACSMLGMTQFALAAHHPPNRVIWYGCPDGPLCDSNPTRSHFRAAISTSMAYGNQQAAGKALTSSQLYTLVQRIKDWQAEADGNGDMDLLYWAVRDNQVALEAKTFDTSKFVPAIRSMGSTIVQWQMAWALANWTRTQRVQFVDQVLSYGYDSLFTNAENLLSELAKAARYAERHPGYHPPVRPFCAMTMSVMVVWGFIGAIGVATADPFAAVAGVVAASAGMLWMMGGCM